MLFQSFKSFDPFKSFSDDDADTNKFAAMHGLSNFEGKAKRKLDLWVTLCGCPSDSNDSLGEDRLDDFLEAFAHFAVVGERLDEAGLAGETGSDAGGDELAGVDQQPGADAFLQAMLAEISHFGGEADDLSGEFFRYAGFMFDDAGFNQLRWVVEFDGDETLARARF